MTAGQKSEARLDLRSWIYGALVVGITSNATWAVLALLTGDC